MKKRTTALLCLTLAGCAPIHYNKPGGTEEEFQRTLAGCRAGSAFVPQGRTPPVTYPRGAEAPGMALAGAGQDLQNVGAQMGYIEDCLRAQGWVPEGR